MLNEISRRLDERRAARFDVVGLGECSIDEVWMVAGALERGAKLRATEQERLGGGQVATAMVAASRLGLRVAFAGAVGDDAAGATVREGLEREGVDVTGVQTVPGATRTALVLVDEGGERTIVERTDRRVALPATPDALIAQAKVLHVDATQIASSIHAAKLARGLGLIVSVDVDHVAPGLDELLALADVCVTSTGLPEKLTGIGDLEQALRALQEKTSAPLLACTLGARGAAALDGGHLLLSPAFPVRAVDTTACGDTFRAGLLRAILDGKGVGDALRFANAAASLKCRALGRQGCPTKAEVDELLARV